MQLFDLRPGRSLDFSKAGLTLPAAERDRGISAWLSTGHQSLSLELLDLFRSHEEQFFPGLWLCFKLSSSSAPWAFPPPSTRLFCYAQIVTLLSKPQSDIFFFKLQCKADDSLTIKAPELLDASQT